MNSIAAMKKAVTQMSKRPLRVGIIGAGNIVRTRHLPNLKALSDVEVAAVCNRRAESARQVAAEWQIPQVYDDWQSLVGDPDIDVVFIGTPPYMHKDISIAALQAGKHTFCQARMAMNYAEALAMVEAAREAEAKGIKAQLCISPIGLSVDAVMRELLESEDVLGTLTHGIVVLNSDSYLDPTTPLHWRQMGHISGYNTLDLGIFVETLHRWIGTFRRVKAMTYTAARHRPLEPEGRLAPVDRPDHVSIVAEHRSGAIVTFQVSGISRSKERYFELHGTKGSIRHVLGEPCIWVHRGSGWEAVEVPAEKQTQWTAEADFIQSIRTGSPVLYPNPTFQDGLKYMEFTEAVFRSSDTGRAVSLPLSL